MAQGSVIGCSVEGDTSWKLPGSIPQKWVCFSYLLTIKLPSRPRWEDTFGLESDSVQGRCVQLSSKSKDQIQHPLMQIPTFKQMIFDTLVEVSQLKISPWLSNTCFWKIISGDYIVRPQWDLNIKCQRTIVISPLSTSPSLHQPLSRTKKNSCSYKRKVLKGGGTLRHWCPLQKHRTSARWEAELWELSLACLTAKVLFLSK